MVKIIHRMPAMLSEIRRRFFRFARSAKPPINGPKIILTNKPGPIIHIIGEVSLELEYAYQTKATIPIISPILEKILDIR